MISKHTKGVFHNSSSPQTKGILSNSSETGGRAIIAHTSDEAVCSQDQREHTIGDKDVAVETTQAKETNSKMGVKKDRGQQSFDEGKSKNPCFFCREYAQTLHCVEIKKSMFKSEDYDELFEGGTFGVCKARVCLRKWITLKNTYDFEQYALMRTVPSLIWLAKNLKKKDAVVLGRLP